MTNLLLLIGIVGLITSTLYALLVLLGAMRFARDRRRDTPEPFLPPVSLLKPLHGLEPDLEAHLESFFCQDYPAFEILFCARHDGDAGLAIARKVAARYPHIRVQFLSSGEPPYPNAKVWSLERMCQSAKHEIFVISDSDVSVTPQYLRDVVASFRDEKVGSVTCLYRGVGERSIWSRLEGVGMSIEMSSGVLVARMLEGMKFTLGPTMAVRRSCVKAFGGFRVLGFYHADDFILGSLVAAHGDNVILSSHVIDHHVLNTSLLSSIAHQIRWMKSTRFSRPKGHLGSALTYSMPYALLAAAAAILSGQPLLALLVLLWGWSSRFALALIVGKLVVDEPVLLRSAFLYPLRDLLGSFYWAASYLSSNVHWRGKVFELLEDGMMRDESAEDKPQEVLTA